MRIIAPLSALALLVGAGAHASAGEGTARFAHKPSAVRNGKRVRISFSVASPVDVAVWITSGDRTVRHLAAGVLGESPPEPFRKGLAQELEWDLTDDAGRPAGAGPFEVHVALGSRAAFDRIFADSREATGGVTGMAVSPDGKLYLLWIRGNGFFGGAHLTVHDRGGRYLRTIMPYSATLPEEKVAGFGRIGISAGKTVPAVYDAEAGAIQPWFSALTKPQGMAVLPDGRILLSSGSGNATNHGPAQHLLTVMPDGSCPPDGYVRMRFSEPRGYLGGTAGSSGASPGHLAVSPGGKWIYFSGVEAMGKRHHGVFRFALDQKYLPKSAWLGDARKHGSDDSHFNAPEGIAVDGAGNLYVADYGNGRVVAFSPEGRRIGAVEVAYPFQVAVHPEKKTVYVLSWANPAPPKFKPRGLTYALPAKPVRLLHRFESISAMGPASSLQLPRSRNFKYDSRVMTLDAGSRVPRLWVSGEGGRQLIPVDDRDGKLAAGENVARNTELAELTDIGVDPAGGSLLLKCKPNYGMARLDLETGKLKPFPLKHAYFPGWDAAGNLYVDHSWLRSVGGKKEKGGCVTRFDPEGKPLAFAGTGKNTAEDYRPAILGNHFSPWGSMCVTPAGDSYVLHGGPRGVKVHKALDHFGPDGRLKRADLIPNMVPGTVEAQVDARGNIYVGMNVRPKDAPLPPCFAGKVPEKWWFFNKGTPEPPWNGGYHNPYVFAAGSIVKFGPEGGECSWPATGEVNAKNAQGWSPKPLRGDGVIVVDRGGGQGALDYYIRGSKWIYRGFGPVYPGKDIRGTDGGCVCRSGRFSLDRFGRLLVPDVLRFSVGLVDGAGNEILRFGAYGNQDSLGAGSAQPVPAIPMYYPIAVDSLLPYVYVADYGNRRVVRVKLTHSAEETCALR